MPGRHLDEPIYGLTPALMGDPFLSHCPNIDSIADRNLLFARPLVLSAARVNEPPPGVKWRA